MKKQILLTLLLGAAISHAQAPQIPMTGNLGAGGSFPAINSPAVVFASDANHTMVFPEMSGSSGLIVVTSTVSLTATRNLVVPLTKGFNWQVQNSTTGGQSIVVIGTSGTGVTIPNGATANVHSDGTNVTSVTATTSLSVTGPCPAGGTGSCAIGTPGSGATPTAGKDIMNDITGQGWGESIGTGAFSSFCTPLNALCSGSGGTPGGSNTQIQFNNSGAFGGSHVTWDGSHVGIPDTRIGAVQAGSMGAADDGTIWSFDTEITSVLHAGYVAGLLGGLRAKLGADNTSLHFLGSEGIVITGDNFHYHALHGTQGDAENGGTGTVDELIGTVGFASNDDAGTATAAYGTSGTVIQLGSGVITKAVGIDGYVDNQSTGTIGTAYASLLEAPTSAGGGIGTLYGQYIQPMILGGTNYNLFSAGAATHNTVEGDLKVGFGSTPSDVCTQAVPCGGGGGSTSNPTTCTTSGPGVICLGLAPYYASGLGATATTTVGTTSPGTSVTLTSATSFAANQGIAIAGAGAAAGLYIGKITGLSGAVATITPATSTSVGAGAVVQHDETAALTAAIAAIGTATRGDIYFPCGTMLMNGPLQDTSHADSIILMPSIQSYSADPTIIGLHGCQPPNSTGAYTSLNSTTIKTSINSGSIIGGYNGLGIYAPLTNVWITTDNLHFILPDNPGIVAVNAHNILQLQANHIWCETTGTTRSNTAGACVSYPTLSNQVANTGDDLTAINMYTGFIIGEHTRIGSMYGSGLTKGFVFDTGTNVSIPSDESNGIAVGYLWCGSCTVPIATGSVGATVNIQMASIESPASYCVDDPSNLLTGQINYKMNTIAGSGLCTFNGAANVQLNNLLFPSATVGGMAGSVNFYTLGTHTADTTIAHDGAGSITVQGSGSLGYIQRVYNPSGPATFFTTTGSTSTTAYAALNVGGTAAGFPNWLQLLYIPSTASGIGGVYQPNTGIIRTDTGATNGLLLDAGATGSTVRMATQDVVRGTWSAAGLALPAGEAFSIGGDASISRPLAGALAIAGESTTAGYSTKVTTASSSAIMQIHTSCTAAGCYDAQSIGDFPNWVQMFYFPSTWTGSGFTINPNSAVINVGTGASGGLVLNADATGATVKIGTESTLRATFSSSGITLPAGESYGAAILGNGMTATTQSAGDNSTKVATTAYVDFQINSNAAIESGLSPLPANTCSAWFPISISGASVSSTFAASLVSNSPSDLTALSGLIPKAQWDGTTTQIQVCNVTSSASTVTGWEVSVTRIH